MASRAEHSLAGRSSQPRAAGPGLGDPTPSISTMKEDLETLLALERANIIANYTQVRPSEGPSTLGAPTAGTREAQVGPRAKDGPIQPRQGPESSGTSETWGREASVAGEGPSGIPVISSR
ncbi:hypothetical protein GH733_007791 [Mirounga leonina]|nr:hypothetical protein GH733_007791 [Mirounga leonina]